MSVSDEEFWKAQRRYRRANVLWPATLAVGGLRFDCIILDLSANGARLRIGPVPDETPGLVLEAPRFGALGAAIAWRRDGELGLRFVDDPEHVADLLGDMLPAVRTIATPVAAAG